MPTIPKDCPYDGVTERRSDNDHAIRLALLEQAMDSIRSQLSGINSSIQKLVWLVLAALIMAVLKLILLPN